MRKQITSKVTPSTLLDGQRLGVPEYWQIDRASEASAWHKWYRHAMLDIGGAQARKEQAILNRRVRRLTDYVGRHGCHVAVVLDRPYEIGRPGLRMRVWIIRANTIMHEVTICSVYGWRRGDDVMWRTWNRVDAVWRALERLRADRKTERAKKAAEYLDDLSPEVRKLAETARPTCLRVSMDGRSVTEILHDCGGSMTSIDGCNGWSMPKSLAEMQATHDRVYHICDH